MGSYLRECVIQQADIRRIFAIFRRECVCVCVQVLQFPNESTQTGLDNV